MHNLIIVGLAGNGKSSVGNIILHKKDNDIADSDIKECKCTLKKNETFSVVECQGMADGLEDLYSLWNKAENALKLLESHKSVEGTEAHSESDDSDESKKEDMDVPDIQNQADGNEPNSKHQKIVQCKNEENDTNTAERKEANSQDNPTNVDPKPGFDALIFVIKYGVRFTKQDTKSVKLIKDIFGEDIFKNRGIIVMTFGDNLDHTDFETFLSKIQGDLKDLKGEVNNRFVLMNKNANETDKRKKVQELEQKILEIKQNKQKYDINEFKENKLKKQNLFFKEQSLTLEQNCKKIIWEIKNALRNGTDINSFTERVSTLHKHLNSFNENANEEMCKILNTHFVDYVTNVIKANKKHKEKSLFIALNILKQTAKNKIEKN